MPRDPREVEKFTPLTYEERLALVPPEKLAKKKIVDDRNTAISTAGRSGHAQAIYGGREK